MSVGCNLLLYRLLSEVFFSKPMLSNRINLLTFSNSSFYIFEFTLLEFSEYQPISEAVCESCIYHEIILGRDSCACLSESFKICIVGLTFSLSASEYRLGFLLEPPLLNKTHSKKKNHTSL